MLRILSWNIRQGGGSRISKIQNSISNLAPEILVLSEFRNNESGRKIRYHLLEGGYRHQGVSHAKSDVNSIAIFSKLPCNFILHPSCDEEYGSNLLSAEYDAFKLFGMYLPHKKKHKIFDYLNKLALDLDDLILAGDFNSGINGIDQKGDSFWYEPEFKELLQACPDAFRLINQDVKEYSWYSHQGNGYRYDHSLISNALMPIVKDCQYLHDWREEGLSDHSPMLLTLA